MKKPWELILNSFLHFVHFSFNPNMVVIQFNASVLLIRFFYPQLDLFETKHFSQHFSLDMNFILDKNTIYFLFL